MRFHLCQKLTDCFALLMHISPCLQSLPTCSAKLVCFLFIADISARCNEFTKGSQINMSIYVDVYILGLCCIVLSSLCCLYSCSVLITDNCKVFGSIFSAYLPRLLKRLSANLTHTAKTYIKSNH